MNTKCLIRTLVWLVALVPFVDAHAGAPTSTQLPQGLRVGGSESIAHAQLPDGRTLTMGEDGLWLTNSDGHKNKPLAGVAGRRFASVTVLPTGQVLIWGGLDNADRLLEDGLWFDAATNAVAPTGDLGLLPRAGHAATVLTDGRLAVFGGWSVGGLVSEIELWDPRTHHAQSISASDEPVRLHPTVLLGEDDRVVIRSGVDTENRPIGDAISFDSNTLQVRATAVTDNPRAVPAIAGSLPTAESTDAPVTAWIAARFNVPLAVTSLNHATVTLLGPAGDVAANVTPVDEGRLVFLIPKQDLFPATRYTVFINGAVDQHGTVLSFVAFDFTTASILLSSSPDPRLSLGDLTRPVAGQPTSASASTGGASDQEPIGSSLSPQPSVTTRHGVKPDVKAQDSTAGVDAERWIPNADNRNGKWRTDRPLPEKFSKRRNDAMALHLGAYNERFVHSQRGLVSGIVLRQSDQPLANVIVSIGNKRAKTGNDGEFRLSGVSPGQQELIVDGRAAGDGVTTQFGYFVIGVNVSADRETPMEPIFLPKILQSDWIDLPSPMTDDAVITNPIVPGMEIRIPKGAVLRDHEGKIVTKVAVVPMPLDRAPFPFPANAPAYVTVQPGGMIVQGLTPGSTPGIRVLYPNQTGLQPGERVLFWSYHTDEQGWRIYGEGQTSSDGSQVVPDPGVALYESVGFMYTQNNPQAPDKAPPVDRGPGSDPPVSSDKNNVDGGGDHKGSGDCSSSNSAKGGDPIDCKSGLFVLDRTDTFVRGAVPIVISRTYRPGDTVSRSFGYGTQLSYGMYLREVSGIDIARYTQYDLILPNGAYARFYRTSPGTDYFSVIAVHNTSASSWYGSILDHESNTYVITTLDGTKYIFTENGNLIAIKDRYSNQLTIGWNGGQITRITSPSGRYADFTYDTSSRITQIKDSTNRTWGYQYTNGFLTQVTYPDQLFEQYGYDGSGNMLTLIDRNGTTIVTNYYDANGRVYQQNLADGGTYRFNYTVDSGGNVTQTNVTDPLNNVRTVTYDPHGYKASVTYAYGTSIAQTTIFERDLTSGLLTAIVDPLNRRTELLRDYSTGSVIQRTALAGTANAIVEKYSYTPNFNQLSSYTDPRGKATVLGSDSNGSLLSVTDPLQHQSSFTHDSAGRLLSSANAVGGTASATYNAVGDLQTIKAPLNRTLTIARDPLGRNIGITDPMNRSGGITYDSLGMGRVHTVTDRNNKTTTIEYYPNGTVQSITDPNNGRTQFGYDGLGRMTSRTDALNQGESWQYDLAGNLYTYTDRKQQTTTYHYDALNRPSLITFADGSTITPTFDSGNRLTHVVDSVSGTIDRSYNDLNQLLSETTPQGTVSYTYDANGRRQTMTPGAQAQITYGYDDSNRLTSITQGSENVGFGYDAANRRTSMTLPNGIVTSYAYDIADQLTGISYRSGTTVLANLVYGYDADGRRVTKRGGFAADLSPTLTSGSSQFDLNNRQTVWNGFSLGYDVNGDATQDPSTNPTTTYTFDVRHRLTQIQQNGTTIANFSYDTFGRRMSKTVNGVTTSFLYDGANPVQEAQGATTSAILTGAGIDERFARDESAGKRYFLADALGSTLALTDSAGGVQQTYGYEPYGEVSSTGSSNNPYQYTGRENDGTGLYYYRARYYSPTLKRFISEDPIGLAGGINSYSYAEGNPIGNTDPSGELANVSVSGGDVRITIPIYYYGPGADAQTIAMFNKGIESTWKGTFGDYNVTTDVVNTNSPEGSNSVYVPCGDEGLKDGRSFVSNGIDGFWAQNSPGYDMAWVAAHEAGHFMGLPDHYLDGPDTKSRPFPGLELSHEIMANYGGAPDQWLIQSIININSH